MNNEPPLEKQKCQPCERLGSAWSKEQAVEILKNIPEWQIDENGKVIFRDYLTKNFMAAIGLINKIAVIAESEEHHPDIHLTGYRELRVELSTHTIGGLSGNDFIVASKINTLAVDLKQ